MEGFVCGGEVWSSRGRVRSLLGLRRGRWIGAGLDGGQPFVVQVLVTIKARISAVRG